MANTARLTPERSRKRTPVTQRDDVTILDINRYLPFLLNAVSSAWQRKTSAIYRKEFGLGIVEWRVIAMLNIEPEITANRICEVVRLDKGATSRSLKQLESLGYAASEASSSDPRKRRWRLTDKGLKAHDDIMAIALSCEAEMVEGLGDDELTMLVAGLKKLLANLER